MISSVLNFMTFSEKCLIFSVKSDVFAAPQPRHGAAVAKAKVNMAKKRQFRQIATEFSTLIEHINRCNAQNEEIAALTLESSSK